MLLKEYFDDLTKAIESVDENELNNFIDIIRYHIKHKFPIVVFGNGGSSAISEHLSCDFMKCIRDSNSDLEPYVINLSSNVSAMTALSNDFSYEDVYAKQIEWMPFKHALIIAITSSGKSSNIVNALEKSSERGYNSIGLVGFDGGEVKNKNLCNCLIHVKSNDYGIVEDSHHILMHYISKKLSKK